MRTAPPPSPHRKSARGKECSEFHPKTMFGFSCLTSFLLLTEKGTSLECFFCRHTLKSREVGEGIDQHPECMSHEMFGALPEMRRPCVKRELFCTSTVTNLNGYFIEVERDCDEKCKPMCVENGFGLGYTECTRCCNSSLCNNFDGKEYYLPMTSSRHALTSWLIAACVISVII